MAGKCSELRAKMPPRRLAGAHAVHTLSPTAGEKDGHARIKSYRRNGWPPVGRQPTPVIFQTTPKYPLVPPSEAVP